MKWMSENATERKITQLRYISAMLVLWLIFIPLSFGWDSVSADGGMIPYDEFSVYEPGQKAIIAWDGTEEIMILSVDVYSEQSTKALHMVPFPSLPEVELGTVESFMKINEIMNRNNWMYGEGKYYGNDTYPTAPANSVEIIFEEQIGPHDITATKVNSPRDFTNWVNNFLEGKGIYNKKLPPELDKVVGHYINQNIPYFVFDVIDLNPSARSIEPIIYKFKSNYLLFPLEISSIIKGETKITLALLTPNDLPISSRSLKDLGFNNRHDEIISRADIKGVSKEIALMFDDYCRLAVYEGYFQLIDLEDDVIIKRLSNVNWMLTLGNSFESTLMADFDDDGNKELHLVTEEKLTVFDAKRGLMIHTGEFNKEVWYDILPYKPLDANQDGVGDVMGTSMQNSYFTIHMVDGLDGDEIWRFNFDEKNIHYHIQSAIDPEDNNVRIIAYDYDLFDDDAIYVLNCKTGKQLWKVAVDEEVDGHISRIVTGDVNGDGVCDIIVDHYQGGLVALNGKNGIKLWSAVTFSNNPISQLEVGNIDDDAEPEILCRLEYSIHALDGKSGDELWTYEGSWAKGRRIQWSTLSDINGDGKSEIIVQTESDVQILDGMLGAKTWEIDLNPLEDQYGNLREFTASDMDDDGTAELLGQSYDKLFAFDIESGATVWEFTTGDPISSYEVVDIDADEHDEVVLITGDKLYTVEYQTSPEESYSSEWGDERNIILGSIVLPIIILVVIVIVVMKVMDDRIRK
ncbi:DUF2330 domain-containing protein [[Eubacterium] cellulosolvens]